MQKRSVLKNKYDLILIGTGFASSFFLKKYLDKSSKNAKVLVLERGVFFPHERQLSLKRGELKQKIYFRIQIRISLGHLV